MSSAPQPERPPLTARAVEGFVTKYLLPSYDRASPIKWFHREMWADCCDPYPYVADAYPRGHSKSATVNLGYSLAAALMEAEPFQIKVSRTRPVCVEFLRNVKNQLADNELLREDFGILPIKEWPKDTEDDFICRLESGYEFRMIAFGCEQPMRGINWNTRRPSLVICDDMEDDEQVMSPERREKVKNWFLGALLPIGSVSTRFRVVGTVLHAESLLQSLLESDEWKSHRYEACDEQVSQESILWPELFPRERLLKVKKFYAEQGNLVKFNMEYRNIAVDTSSGFFQVADFVPTEESDVNKRLTFYVGVDYAISTKEKRDFTVMVVGGLDEEGYLYVVDVRRGRWDGKEILDEMFSIQDTYEPEQWFVESGAIQKALGAALEIEQRQRNVYLNLNPMVPTKDKMSRARSIQARMRSRGVRFDKRNGWFAEFESELIQFPRGRHDDQVDGMAWLGLGLAAMVTPERDIDIEAEMLRESREQAQPFGFGISPVCGY